MKKGWILLQFLEMLFIIVWNVAGLLVIPKIITKSSIVSTKYSLSLITCFNLYVKTITDVQFGRIFGTTKLQDKLRDKEKWVLVLDCYGINNYVILYQLESAIYFLDEEY